MSLLALLETSHLKNSKLLAILIDPDKFHLVEFSALNLSAICEVDIILIGGSLVSVKTTSNLIDLLKKQFKKPIFLFPGNVSQIIENVDGILFLSLISGRNPEYLIGQHVIAAPLLKKLNIEVLPTAYLLINGGITSSTAYISNTTPIPSDKTDIAICTALAGEFLGLKTIFLDAGSGALNPVSPQMITAVYGGTNVPIIVGGGINTHQKAKEAYESGATLIVVGNMLEENTAELNKIIEVKKELNLRNYRS